MVLLVNSPNSSLDLVGIWMTQIHTLHIKCDGSFIILGLSGHFIMSLKWTAVTTIIWKGGFFNKHHITWGKKRRIVSWMKQNDDSRGCFLRLHRTTDWTTTIWLKFLHNLSRIECNELCGRTLWFSADGSRQRGSMLSVEASPNVWVTKSEI